MLLHHETILVIDEAGMLGTRDTAALVRATGRAERQLVLVGDDAQLLPRGSRQAAPPALAARLEAICLESNRGRRGTSERQALVDLRAGPPERGVAAYVLAGRVTVGRRRPRPSARAGLVTDWLDARRRGGDCLMIAARRRDARDLSRRAREALVAAGEVSRAGARASERRLRGRRSGDDAAQPARARRAERHAGHGGGGRTSRPGRSPSPRTMAGGWSFRARYLEAGHLAHGYAVTAHKAQGLTVERAFVLGGDEVYREWGYTALSRAREATRLYLVGGEPLRELLADDLGRPPRRRAARAAGGACCRPGAQPGAASWRSTPGRKRWRTPKPLRSRTPRPEDARRGARRQPGGASDRDLSARCR